MATAKKAYRVVMLGASYYDQEPGFAPDGSDITLQVYRVARQGEVVQLTDRQANRLLALNAIKDADAPASYSELDESALQDQADERGVVVRGSGANGEVLRGDIVVALENYDRAVNAQESALASAEQAVPVAGITGDYGQQPKDDLAAEAARRGLTVEGTGADGSVLKDDLVAALQADDQTRTA